MIRRRSPSTSARRLIGRTLPLGVLLISTAACAERGPRGADPQLGTPEALFREHLGQTWELVRLGDQEVPQPWRTSAPSPGRHPGPGTRPTI
jgi:hypothetical protein